MENVHQLKIFAAVADTLSFTRAAERLYLTQSAVSHQIAKLERELGCELLAREGRNVSLTLCGRVLADQARRVFASIQAAVDATRQADQPESGRIRISASNTACQYIIPEALREFRESFPGYSLSITPGDSPVSEQHLLGGTTDLALMIRSGRNRQLQFEPLFEDELQFIVSPLHPWAKAGRADRKEYAAQKMILYGRNSTTSRMIEHYFARLQSPLRDWIELGDIGAIKELVKIGLGISILAPWVAAPENEQGSLVSVPLAGSRLRRQWCIASMAGRKLSLAEQTFINLCQAVTAKMPQ